MSARLLNPLFFFIANATHTQLARQIQYLKAENEILRAHLPKRIQITPSEKARLIRFAKPLGSAIKELVSIVSPVTILRWMQKGPAKPCPRKPGRPRTPAEWEELVLRIAKETGWGYTRLLGELRKLGFRGCRSTVKNILDRHGHTPHSTHRDGSWDQFIKSHAESLWACDFFVKKVWTTKGLRTFYVLFALHIGSRRVRVLGHTQRAGSAWMVQQARALRQIMGPQPCTLLCDGDVRFDPLPFFVPVSLRESG